MAHRLNVIEQSIRGLESSTQLNAPCLVEKAQLQEMMELCRIVCFPQYSSAIMNTRRMLNRIGIILADQLVNGFTLRDTYERFKTTEQELEPPFPIKYGHWEAAKTKSQVFRQAAEYIVDEFLLCRFAKVKVLLKLDVDALFLHDVAAESKCEVVLCYPGITCMLHQRIAHELFCLGAPNNVTRMLTEMAHSLTGIDIHPQTSIGHHFFVDHGTGVVIGATAIIGNHVCIYQGVTLGAKSFPVDAQTGKKIKFLPRHPIIEDRVTIYSNAVVLGRIVIGKNSTIAGNAWVTKDVPPNSTVTQQSGKVVKDANASAVLFTTGDGGGI